MPDSTITPSPCGACGGGMREVPGFPALVEHNTYNGNAPCVLANGAFLRKDWEKRCDNFRDYHSHSRLTEASVLKAFRDWFNKEGIEGAYTTEAEVANAILDFMDRIRALQREEGAGKSP